MGYAKTSLRLGAGAGEGVTAVALAAAVLLHLGTPKPPHAHFCRVTQQCVLNYDHYCPWCVSGLPLAPLP